MATNAALQHPVSREERLLAARSLTLPATLSGGFTASADILIICNLRVDKES
jgi:hypothetical protein